MKNSISQCSKCERISAPLRWSCMKCGVVPQNEIADLEGKAVATTTVLKSPDNGIKSMSIISLLYSKSGVFFLS